MFVAQESGCSLSQITQGPPGAQKKTRWLLTVMGGEICRWPTAVSCTNIIQNEEKHMRSISKIVTDKLDSEHGPLESFVGGPPLVGIFEVDEVQFLK